MFAREMLNCLMLGEKQNHDQLVVWSYSLPHRHTHTHSRKLSKNGSFDKKI